MQRVKQSVGHSASGLERKRGRENTCFPVEEGLPAQVGTERAMVEFLNAHFTRDIRKVQHNARAPAPPTARGGSGETHL